MKKGDLSDLIGGADTNTSEVVSKSNLNPSQNFAFAACCESQNCRFVNHDVNGWSASCDCAFDEHGYTTGRDATTVAKLEEAVKACYDEMVYGF